MTSDSAHVTAVRARAISFRDDPFHASDALVEIEDALVVTAGGVITAVGPYASLGDALPPEAAVHHYPGMLVSAGFVDLHVHYVQTQIVGAYGAQLLDWLERYAFPEEQRFADRAYAEAVARIFFDRLLAHGTTTALAFCATYPESVDAFFRESERRGTRMIAGKVLMDRNAPEALLDSPESGQRASAELIARWHGRGRNAYAVTPRFAPTSTPAQLDVAHNLWSDHPGTYLHTHLAETEREVAWVRELFPARSSYVDVYDHHGLIGPRAVMAHGVHLTDDELDRLHTSSTALAHCPTSNLFLGSGLFDLRRANSGERAIRIGLGTDIGAGTSFSLLSTMNEAYKVAALGAGPVSGPRLFYLGTAGGARALDLDDVIGSLEVGKEADLVVLDPCATPVLAACTARADSIDEVLFALAMLGDDRAVAAAYVAGGLAHRRGEKAGTATKPSR
jgi:guanine deaminase